MGAGGLSLLIIHLPLNGGTLFSGYWGGDCSWFLNFPLYQRAVFTVDGAV